MFEDVQVFTSLFHLYSKLIRLKESIIEKSWSIIKPLTSYFRRTRDEHEDILLNQQLFLDT